MIPQILSPYQCTNPKATSDSYIFFFPPDNQNKSCPNVLISIVGQQFTDQAISYLVRYIQGSIDIEPNVGSILLDLLLCQPDRSYGIYILLAHTSVKLSNLDHVPENSHFKLPQYILEDISRNRINSVYTICSHFIPMQNFIAELKHSRELYKSYFPIIELQHGWIFGKLSCLRKAHQNHFNPDIYLVMDTLSCVYLRKVFPFVKVILIGDVLLSKQIYAYKNSSLPTNTLHHESSSASKQILVCFSEKDIHLGYTKGKLLKIKSRFYPEEIKPFLLFLAKKFSSLSLSIRSKPHQEKKDLHQFFNYKNDQLSLVHSLIHSDFVVSALSTVSISASLCGIPSCFYITNPKATHKNMIRAYSKNVFYIHSTTNETSYTEFFGDNIDEKFPWIQFTIDQRISHLIHYADSALAKFNNHFNSILKSNYI